MPGNFWNTLKSSLGTNKGRISPTNNFFGPPSPAPPAPRQIASGQSPQEMRENHARVILPPTTSRSELRASHVGKLPSQVSGSQPDLRTVLEGKAKIQREGFVPLTSSRGHQVQTAPTASQHFVMSQDKQREANHDAWRASAKSPAKPHGSKVEDLRAAKTDRTINGAPLHDREAAKIARADLQDSGYKGALRAAAVAEKIEGAAEIVGEAADVMVKASFVGGSPHVAATVATANMAAQVVLHGAAAGAHATSGGLARAKLGEGKAGDSQEAALNRGRENTGLGSAGTRNQFGSDFIKDQDAAAKREAAATARALVQGAAASTGMEWATKGMEGVREHAASSDPVAKRAAKAAYDTQQAMGSLATNAANLPGKLLHKKGEAITRKSTEAASHDLPAHFSSPEGTDAARAEEMATRTGEAVVDHYTGRAIDKVIDKAEVKADSRRSTSSKDEKKTSTDNPLQAKRSSKAERLAQMKPPTAPPPKRDLAHEAASSAVEHGHQIRAESSAAERLRKPSTTLTPPPKVRRQAWPERPSTS